jgi:hypothetical protein
MKTTSEQSKATPDSRQVVFDETSKPPQETQPAPLVVNDRPSPRVIKPHTSITKATIDNPLHEKSQPPSISKISPANIKLRNLIQAATNSRARISQCHQMNLCRQE